MTHTHLDGLRVDHLVDPKALAGVRPRFSWQISPGYSGRQNNQTSYRIVVLAHRTECEEIVADTGRVDSSDCVVVPVPGFEGDAGRAYTWRLEVWLDESEVPLTETRQFGIAHQDWTSSWVTPEQVPVVLDGALAATMEEFARTAAGPPLDTRLHPPRLLRHEFRLGAKPARAMLRVTSQGIYHATVNGLPTGDDLLAPGWDAYHLVQPVVTYDISAQLNEGSNVLGVVLGDGWYAGRISFLGRSAQYGDTLRASWELHVELPDGDQQIIRPDESVVSSRGPIDWSDLFIGERHDARREKLGWDMPGFDTGGWTPCAIEPFTQTVRPFSGEPVRRLQELPASNAWRSQSGDWIVDFGQVIAGRVRMSVQGAAGTTVRLEHSEVVTPDGEFMQNILGPNKDQTDEYILSGQGLETWEPLLTFHGFRYVRVTGYPGPIQTENFIAVVIGDDLKPTAGFVSSDAALNRLFENVVWSQRANFLSVPTDCPQRERAGYTGDIQIFAPTAATLMGVAGVLNRWLGTVRLEQDSHDGIVPVVSPEPPAMSIGQGDGGPFAEIAAAAGWGDAITSVPWALWEHYGDDRFLRDNVQAMRDWTAVQTRQAQEERPRRLRGTTLDEAANRRQSLLWNGGFHFGDWVTPSTMTGSEDPMEAVLVAPKLTSELVAPMFHAHSLDLLAATLEVLEEYEEASETRHHAAEVRRAFGEEYLKSDGSLVPDLQGMYVLALAFRMVPTDREPDLVSHLVRLIHDSDNHLDTGFLSTPYLLDVLYDHGHEDLARTLMWQDTCPSWLYEVRMGATTMWESWHAIREDGTAEATSMNHYAFGCVADWIVRRLAGLTFTSPGYRTARIIPDLDCALESVNAYIDTPYGTLSIDWRTHTIDADLTITVPPGITAELRLPQSWQTLAPPQLSTGTTTVSATRVTSELVNR